MAHYVRSVSNCVIHVQHPLRFTVRPTWESYHYVLHFLYSSGIPFTECLPGYIVTRFASSKSPFPQLLMHHRHWDSNHLDDVVEGSGDLQDVASYESLDDSWGGSKRLCRLRRTLRRPGRRRMRLKQHWRQQRRFKTTLLDEGVGCSLDLHNVVWDLRDIYNIVDNLQDVLGAQRT